MAANGKLDEIEKALVTAQLLTAELLEEVTAQQSLLKETITSKISTGNIDMDALQAFAEQSYVILPKSPNEYWVIVPRFVPFQIGWLEKQTSSYNIFIINKFVDWITPLPHDIKARLGMEPYLREATVIRRDGKGPVLRVSPDELDKAFTKYKKHLTRRVVGTDDLIHIDEKNEFDLLASLIDDGMLPFEAKQLDTNDMRPDPENIILKPYQERAWDHFQTYGAIGVFWPPGAGKTFITLYIGNRVKGKKLVVVPQLTLKEQWTDRVNTWAVDPSEWEVQTYQYVVRHIKEYQKRVYSMGVFDEAHHLPANSFSKLATLKLLYRIGLSASPYREDGRTEYIFALTGFPIGLKWRELISIGAVREPTVKVYLYNTRHSKRAAVKDLVQKATCKVLIFCDSIDAGKGLSKELGVPFVYGETTNRIEKILGNRVVIASRVADEGVSIPDLGLVIEYDFHHGSRRQEVQRMGRLMHSVEDDIEHIIMMTEEELDKYQKRLYGIEEQGIAIRFERRK